MKSSFPKYSNPKIDIAMPIPALLCMCIYIKVQFFSGTPGYSLHDNTHAAYRRHKAELVTAVLLVTAVPAVGPAVTHGRLVDTLPTRARELAGRTRGGGWTHRQTDRGSPGSSTQQVNSTQQGAFRVCRWSRL